MHRRNFLKSIIAAVACAAIPMGMKKPLSLNESAYEEVPATFDFRRVQHFRMESVETKFGTVHYKTHPLFT